MVVNPVSALCSGSRREGEHGAFGKRIKGWHRRPSLVLLAFVVLLVPAAIVTATMTDDPSVEPPHSWNCSCWWT